MRGVVAENNWDLLFGIFFCYARGGFFTFLGQFNDTISSILHIILDDQVAFNAR